jgi:outer membrane protein assembly factor BamB
VAITALYLFAGPVAAQPLKGDWPMLNFDAQGQRYNPYETILTKQSVKSLHLLWKLDGLNDTQYSLQVSAPVVAGGALFVGSKDGHFYARDAATGKKLWTVKLGVGVTYAPAVANGIVYVPFTTHSAPRRGKLRALDAATGATLWTANLKNSTAGSPTVANGRVFQSGGGDNPLYSFDALTGKLLWKTDMYGGCWGAPAVAHGIVYSLSDDRLNAYSAATGAKLWEQNGLHGGYGVGSAAVAAGKVYGNNGGQAAAYDAVDGTLAWQVGGGPNTSPGVAVAKDHVYALDTAGVVWNYGATNGVASLTQEQVGLRASPTLAKGILYAGAYNGVLAYDVKNGALLWSAPLDNGVQESPVVANGRLYVLSAGSLYAYGLKD